MGARVEIFEQLKAWRVWGETSDQVWGSRMFKGQATDRLLELELRTAAAENFEDK